MVPFAAAAAKKMHRFSIDRESNDFADLMAEEELALTEGDTQHNISYVACLKVRSQPRPSVLLGK